MEIKVTQEGVWQLVNISGHLDTNTAPEAESLLDQLTDDGAQKIIVDFKDLEYISSAGLRILLVTAKKLKTSGGLLRLCCLNETVAEVFDISGFNTIFSIFEDHTQAMEN